MQRTLPSNQGREGFVRLWDLYVHIDADTGFQFDGDAVIPDGYLFDPASYQRFFKFGGGG